MDSLLARRTNFFRDGNYGTLCQLRGTATSKRDRRLFPPRARGPTECSRYLFLFFFSRGATSFTPSSHHSIHKLVFPFSSSQCYIKLNLLFLSFVVEAIKKSAHLPPPLSLIKRSRKGIPFSYWSSGINLAIPFSPDYLIEK